MIFSSIGDVATLGVQKLKSKVITQNKIVIELYRSNSGVLHENNFLTKCPLKFFWSLIKIAV